MKVLEIICWIEVSKDFSPLENGKLGGNRRKGMLLLKGYLIGQRKKRNIKYVNLLINKFRKSILIKNRETKYLNLIKVNW